MAPHGRALLRPSGQIYTGHLYDCAAVTPALMKTGQVSQMTQANLDSKYGRYLSGLSGADCTKGPIPADQGVYYDDMDFLSKAEEDDDNYGSGIFDPDRREATANVDQGVFASNYSLPGYLARESPYAVSKDIVDVTSGAEVVRLPAGGMAYVERDGRLVGPLKQGGAVPYSWEKTPAALPSPAIQTTPSVGPMTIPMPLPGGLQAPSMFRPQLPRGGISRLGPGRVPPQPSYVAPRIQTYEPATDQRGKEMATVTPVAPYMQLMPGRVPKMATPSGLYQVESGQRAGFMAPYPGNAGIKFSHDTRLNQNQMIIGQRPAAVPTLRRSTFIPAEPALAIRGFGDNDSSSTFIEFAKYTAVGFAVGALAWWAAGALGGKKGR